MKKLIFLILTIGLIWLYSTGDLLAQGTPIFSDTIAVLDTYGRPGDTVDVTLYMANPSVSVWGFFHRIVYNDTLLQPISIQCADRGCVFDAYSMNMAIPGVIRILAYTFNPGGNIARGTGPVGRIKFRIRPTAPPGRTTALEFVDNVPADEYNSWSDSSGTLLFPRTRNGNISITIVGQNQPPVISSIGSQSVAEGQTIQFGVTAHDPDGDPLTLTAQNLPANSSFPVAQGDSVVNSTFTFSPDFTQGPNTYNIDFVATDNANNTTHLTVPISVLDQPNDFLNVSSLEGGLPGARDRTVDISLLNNRLVYGCEFQLLYDPTQITIPNIYTVDRASDIGFWYNEPEAGRIIILLFSTGLDSLGAGSGPVIQMVTDVSVDAAFGPTQLLIDSAFVVINPDGTTRDMVVENGFFTVDRFGDANLDGILNVGDCVSVVAFIIGRLDLNLRRFDAADLNRDGYVNIADLQAVIDFILQYELDRFPIYIQPMVFVELSGDLVPIADEITVPLYGTINAEAAGFEFNVNYNPEKLELIEISPSAMISNLSLEYHTDNGNIEGVAYDLGGRTFGPDAGSLVELRFRVLNSEISRLRDIRLTDFMIVSKGASFIPSVIKPETYELAQNYPNPFNPSTKIDFYLPEGGIAELSVYDMLGRRITVLHNGNIASGNHSFEWNGKSDAGEPVVSGIYFYRLKAGDFDQTKKMTLLR